MQGGAAQQQAALGRRQKMEPGKDLGIALLEKLAEPHDALTVAGHRRNGDNLHYRQHSGYGHRGLALGNTGAST